MKLPLLLLVEILPCSLCSNPRSDLVPNTSLRSQSPTKSFPSYDLNHWEGYCLPGAPGTSTEGLSELVWGPDRLG